MITRNSVHQSSPNSVCR